MIREWHLDTKHIGRRVLVYSQTDSTNTRALEQAGQPNTHGLAFLAEEQLAGRGQQGRRWVAAPGSSVLLSVLLYPPDSSNRPVLLTAWAAVSVCEVVRRFTSQEPRIKWPNDVLLAERKVCGILIEQTRLGGATATVAGIGLNVSQSQEYFQDVGLPMATSLQVMGAVGLESESVARELLKTLDQHYDTLLRGELKILEQQWASYLGLLEKHVLVESLGSNYAGTLLACQFDRVLLDQEGEILSLQPEKIWHIHRV